MKKQFNFGIKLTAEQQKVVKAVAEGVHVVTASAGCGKSTLIQAACSYINAVTNGCCSIIVFSYTKKTVSDLLQKMVNIPNVSVLTFHSFFYRVLRAYGYKSFSFMSNEAETKALMQDVITTNGLEELVSVVDLAEAISKDEYPKEIIKTAADLFLDELKSRRKFTFDSLQYEMLHLLKTNKTVASRIQRTFSHVFQDESQDLSGIQLKILKEIWPRDISNNITYVGDADQAIYSFRGSRRGVMQEIIDYYGAHTHKLSTNFRCSSHDILRNANVVMPSASLRPGLADNGSKVIYFGAENAKAEADYVCSRIKELVAGGADLNDIMVLFRNGNAISKIYDQLIKEQIPFVKTGSDSHSLWNNSKTKRILGLLSYYHEQGNRHWLHCAAPVFGFDAELVKDVSTREYDSLADAVLAMPSISKVGKRKFRSFLEMPSQLSLRNEIILLWDRYLKQFFQEKDDVLLDFVLDATKEFESYAELRHHLEDCRKQEKIQARLVANPNAHYVRLMSIHTSKGMECSHIILCGMTDSILTAHEDTDLEEERRVLFVGMTRAKDSLVVTYSQQSNGHENKPIRFLEEQFKNA